MKSFYILLMALSFYSVSARSSLLSGPISSGGGMGVVCYDSSGDVETVELLDLWEARILYRRDIIPSRDTVRDQAYSFLNNLSNAVYSKDLYSGQGGNDLGTTGTKELYRRLKETTDLLLSNRSHPRVRRLRGVELALTNDVYEVITPIKCKIKQLVRYADRGDILINQDLIDKMDNTNLAALYLHEAFYAHLREAGERSSVRVRRTIGLLFDGYEFQPWSERSSATGFYSYPSSYYDCRSKKSRVLLYMHKKLIKVGVTILPIQVGGRLVIGRPEPTSFVRLSSLSEIFDIGETYFNGNLGDEAGRDYQFVMIVGNEKGESVANIELLPSPDQEGHSEIEDMICKKII